MILENYSSWENLFFNFSKAFKKLEQAVSYIKSDSFNSIKFNPNLNNVLFEIVKEGLIQRFEYTHELAWNVMKDYAEYQGNSTIGGSRNASREAFVNSEIIYFVVLLSHKKKITFAHINF